MVFKNPAIAVLPTCLLLDFKRHWNWNIMHKTFAIWSIWCVMGLFYLMWFVMSSFNLMWFVMEVFCVTCDGQYLFNVICDWRFLFHVICDCWFIVMTNLFHVTKSGFNSWKNVTEFFCSLCLHFMSYNICHKTNQSASYLYLIVTISLLLGQLCFTAYARGWVVVLKS